MTRYRFTEITTNGRHADVLSEAAIKNRQGILDEFYSQPIEQAQTTEQEVIDHIITELQRPTYEEIKKVKKLKSINNQVKKCLVDEVEYIEWQTEIDAINEELKPLDEERQRLLLARRAIERKMDERKMQVAEPIIKQKLLDRLPQETQGEIERLTSTRTGLFQLRLYTLPVYSSGYDEVWPVDGHEVLYSKKDSLDYIEIDVGFSSESRDNAREKIANIISDKCSQNDSKLRFFTETFYDGHQVGGLINSEALIPEKLNIYHDFGGF